MEIISIPAKPTKELLLSAMTKARSLKPNQQIRLTGEADSWWIFNIQGTFYIGYDIKENSLKFLKNIPEQDLVLGINTYKVQRFSK